MPLDETIARLREEFGGRSRTPRFRRFRFPQSAFAQGDNIAPSWRLCDTMRGNASTARYGALLFPPRDPLAV